jgi:hypothetical protein
MIPIYKNYQRFIPERLKPYLHYGHVKTKQQIEQFEMSGGGGGGGGSGVINVVYDSELEIDNKTNNEDNIRF